MSSEVLIVAAGAITIAVFAVAYYTLFPVIYQLHVDPIWDKIDNSRADFVNTQTYRVMGIMPMLLLGGIFFNMYMRATRRQSDEFYA